MIPLYAITPLIMLRKVYVSFISGSYQDVNVSSWLIPMAPFDGWSISLLTRSRILVIGLLRVWLLLFKSATRSVTLRTSPMSASTPIILANCHWLRWQSCSFNITMSPTSKFLLLSFHFCLVYKLCRNSFLHLWQNTSEICCTRLHIFLESWKDQVEAWQNLSSLVTSYLVKVESDYWYHSRSPQ